MGIEPRALTTNCPSTTQTGLPSGPDEGPDAPSESLPAYVLRDAVTLLWREILNLMLEGVIAPSKIGERLDISTDLVRKVQDNTEFIRLYEDAKKDTAASAVDRIKAKAHIYVSEMEKLMYSPDPHVRRAALTDLLNRAGTAPNAKIELGPMAWKKAVDRYIDVSPEKD